MAHALMGVLSGEAEEDSSATPPRRILTFFQKIRLLLQFFFIILPLPDSFLGTALLSMPRKKNSDFNNSKPRTINKVHNPFLDKETQIK